ncbi:MAG: ADP-ribosylglycohydrolase family protein, partial [Myxococcota bacterium]
ITCAVGDAFGEQFFTESALVEAALEQRQPPAKPPWRWTDDTAMAMEVVESLRACEGLDADDLASRLLKRYIREPWRGYGGGTHRLFEEMKRGVPWQSAAMELFGNQGSYGNGAAMRVAPVGAYFADDLDAVREAAKESAVVTHRHIEGQSGAVAVAVATAVIWQTRDEEDFDVVADAVYGEVLARLPAGQVREGVVRAKNTSRTAHTATAVGRLGNGAQITAMDTVPFCLWSMVRNPRDFAEAMWDTVTALGDRDTTCAIVGAALGMCAPDHTIPHAWVQACEPLSGIPLEQWQRSD